MKHTIKVNKTAIYHSLGDLSSAKTIWFVLHGYGYSAERFINMFKPVLNNDTAIIAPEGFSKFYLKGVDGKVGASWMTKDDRENEITDYVNYLNQLYELVLENKSNVKINILGFSQGAATASRWICDNKITIDNFILWCGVFPNDMNFEIISNVKTYFLYGDDDKYVTKDRVTKQQELINNSKLNIKTIVFKGKHEIPGNVLLEQALTNNW